MNLSLNTLAVNGCGDTGSSVWGKVLPLAHQQDVRLITPAKLPEWAQGGRVTQELTI